METWVGITISVLGIIIPLFGYTIASYYDFREKRKILLEKFDFLRKSNSEILLKLYELASNSITPNAIFMQGLTISSCIEILEKARVQLLSEENFELLKNVKSKLRIEEITKNIDIQTTHHMEVQTFIKYFKS